MRQAIDLPVRGGGRDRVAGHRDEPAGEHPAEVAALPQRSNVDHDLPDAHAAPISLAPPRSPAGRPQTKVGYRADPGQPGEDRRFSLRLFTCRSPACIGRLRSWRPTIAPGTRPGTESLC